MEILAFVLGTICLILLWVMLHDTTHFEKTEYVVKDPRIKRSFRAVVLADLHNHRYGRNNQLLLDAIREEKPDLVFLAGDMLTARPGEDFEPALEVLRALAKDFPVCYGVGNHEHRLKLYLRTYGDMAKRYEEALKEFGAKEMVNEWRFFDELGISVAGSQIHQRYYRRREKKPMRETYLKRILGEPDPEKFTVLLAHNPDYFPEYAAWGADLVLSGHVHGGVVRIPFWNRGVISPAIRFFPKYDGGLFREGNRYMLLSRGLGSHTIPIRLFNPGDLIFLRFEHGDEILVEKQGKRDSKKN